MIAARLAVALALATAAGCCPPGFGARAPGGTAALDRDRAAPADARITLFRDGALVEEELAAAVSADGVAVVPIAGDVVTAADLLVSGLDAEVIEWTRVPALAHGSEVVAQLGDRTLRGRALGEPSGGTRAIAADDGVHLVRGEVVTGGPPAVLRVVTRGARGRVTLALRYATPRLTWQASYTLLEERDGRGRLHGAIALDNQTGRRWERARLALVDRLQPLLGASAPTGPRFLTRIAGRFAIGPGEQRLDLGLRAEPLPLRATLVYDPVGTTLDGGAMRPLPDPQLGTQPWPRRIDESVLVDLTGASSEPLPAGTVRLYRVDGAGALAWRGEGTLLPPADDARRITAIAVGRAGDVTGQRTRSMFERDEDRQRLIEEFTLRFRNDRDRPVEVLAREHLYRGKCWILAYHSTGGRIAKEGEQQVGLGVVVPARAAASIVYRVIYTWDPTHCTPSKSTR